MPAKLKTAVLGATGYSGAELTRLLLRHPRVEKPVLLRRPADTGANSNLADTFPSFSGNGSYPLQPLSWPALKQQGVELLFLATPHDASRSIVPEAVGQGLRVIDLSGAWRLKENHNRAVYGFTDADSVTAAQLTDKAVYGLPELCADRIPNAALVANPGCYATSVILALAPLLRAGLVDRERGIISDSKSGVSGAGKEPNSRTHFVSVADNFSAYSVFGHRHLGEMLEQLKLNSCELMFTPHLLPIPRGILSTIYRAFEPRDKAGRNRKLLSRFLCWPALGASFRYAQAATDSVFFAYQLLRSWLLPRRRWPSSGAGLMHRQPAERRCRASRAEHEPDVRME